MASKVLTLKERKDPYRSVARHLSRVQEVAAVFAATDRDGICHIYSVVSEHESAVYKKIAKEEARIVEESPRMQFAFHVRAHQGRKPSLAVTRSVKAIFKR